MFAKPWEHIPPTGPMLRPAAAAEYAGLSLPHLYDLSARGEAPKFVKLGARASAIPKPHLDAWIAFRAGGVR
jgi:predicted DNA-binding transcriptional regulator AlpA